MNFLGDARGIIGKERNGSVWKLMNCVCIETRFSLGEKLGLQDLAQGNLLVLAIQRADGTVLRSDFSKNRSAKATQ